MSTIAPKLETFTLFPLLPIEIRRMIWDTIFEPRVVYLRNHLFKGSRAFSRVRTSTETNMESVSNAAWGYKSLSQIPATICHESLAIVSERRSKAFSTEYIPLNTWFDFQRDILYLCGSHPYCRGGIYQVKLLSVDTTRVERLAVFGVFEEHNQFSVRWLRRVLEVFSNVKHLIVVERQHAEDDGDLVMMDGVLNIEKAISIFLETDVVERSVEERLEKLQHERREILEYRSPETMDMIKHHFLESRPSNMPIIERRTFATREKELELQQTKKAYCERRDAHLARV